MRIRLAFTAITLVALSVVGCTPDTLPPVTHGGFPVCESLPASEPCVEVEWESGGDGSGVLFQPSGEAFLINFWADGEFELH